MADSLSCPPRKALPPCPGWKTVRLGLDLVIGATLSFGALIILTFVIFWLLFGGFSRTGTSPRLSSIFLGHLALIQWVAAAAGIITFMAVFLGFCLCIAAPRSCGTRSLAIASVAAMALGPMMHLQLIFLKLGPPGDRVIMTPIGVNLNELLSVARFLTLFISVIIFLFFLRAVGRCYENARLATSAEMFVMFLVLSALIVAPVLGTAAAEWPFAGFMFVGLITANFVWLVKLIVRARRVIDEYCMAAQEQ
jgi:hypothetical protein